jgi:hypothetical protein
MVGVDSLGSQSPGDQIARYWSDPVGTWQDSIMWSSDGIILLLTAVATIGRSWWEILRRNLFQGRKCGMQKLLTVYSSTNLDLSGIRREKQVEESRRLCLPELAMTWSRGQCVGSDSVGGALCGRTRCKMNVTVPISDCRQVSGMCMWLHGKTVFGHEFTLRRCLYVTRQLKVKVGTKCNNLKSIHNLNSLTVINE